MTDFSHKRGAGFRLLLPALIITTLLAAPAWSQVTYRPELKPYVEFLTHQRTSAKDYILGLFKTHDLVVVCERAHGDTTQYDLYLSIFRDPRFIDSVGLVFTEIGTSTQAKNVNAFEHAEGLSADSIDRAVLHFQRNCSFDPVWVKYNYSYLLRGIHAINEGLPPDRKISLFNSDIPFDWNTIDSAGLKNLWGKLDSVVYRDSIMAVQIIRQFDEICASGSKRHKALVILNYRHAFRNEIGRRSGGKFRNAGWYLNQQYANRTAYVLINGIRIVSARSDNDLTLEAIQDGKWDAAFKVQGIRDLGFDFKGSPFGRDDFDTYPVKSERYEDEFDGFVFYLPLEEHMNVFGIPGFVDSAFTPELVRRYALYSTLGRDWKPITNIEEEKPFLNNKRRSSPYPMDSLNSQIQKWLRP